MFKKDLINIFRAFFDSANFSHRFSSPMITLILKFACLTSLNDFRPISLLKWVHKFVARVLAARLQRILESLVCDTRSVFICDRSIYDSCVVASEVVDEMSKERRDSFSRLISRRRMVRLIENLYGSFWLKWVSA